MVRFFGKPRKEAAAGDKPVRASRTIKLEALPPPEPAEEPERKPRRRTTRATPRPPRRDWAAEAAATPVDAPAPPAQSFATGEEIVRDYLASKASI